MEKIMEAIQIAVEQILTVSMPQIIEKGLQSVGPCCRHPAWTHLGVVPSLQECLCCYQPLAKLGCTCQASSTASFTFTWPTETSLVVVSLRSNTIALETGRHRPVNSSVPCCSTFHSAPAVATVGMVVTPEAGTPCTCRAFGNCLFFRFVFHVHSVHSGV